MRFRAAPALAALALAGCIPPSAPRQASDTPAEPRIADPVPLLDTVFDEQPVWKMLPVRASATDVDASEYIVKSGDTLRGIGERTGAGSETLARVNQLSPPYLLHPGQRLVVPGGRFHKVSAGETGIAIAQAYGVDWTKIIELNALSEPYSLRIGQRLMLPAGAEASAQSVEARAAAFRIDIDDILTGGEPAVDPQLGAAAPTRAPSAPLAPNVAVADPKAFTGGFIWPATGTVVQRFGPAGEGLDNQGIEIRVDRGAPIRAAGNGVVAFVGDHVANYGGLILIRHGDGWITAYGRAAQALVTRGQAVKRGETIGRAGAGSTPLLFFQMRKNQLPVDPLKQLSAP